MNDAIRPRVLVTRPIPENGIELLQMVADVEVWGDPMPPAPEVLAEKVRDVEGLVALLTDRIDEELLSRAPKLRVISNMAVGYNNIDVSRATARRIPIGNTPGVLTDATADLAVALLLSAARRVVEGHEFATSGEWRTWDPLGHLGVDLVGRVAGIVGMGRIGYAVARRLHFGWNMNILYTSRSRKESAERDLAAVHVPMDRLLAESDFVFVLTDLNPSTTHLFNRDAFAQMKPSAIFVNAARGGLHNQHDLVEALRSGQILAAGLDVTDPEPPDADDPLLKLKNVVITPHIASATFQTRGKMAEMAAKNVIAGLKGERLPHCVNPEVYDKL